MQVKVQHGLVSYDKFVLGLTIITGKFQHKLINKFSPTFFTILVQESTFKWFNPPLFSSYPFLLAVLWHLKSVLWEQTPSPSFFALLLLATRPVLSCASWLYRCSHCVYIYICLMVTKENSKQLICFTHQYPHCLVLP